MGYDLYCPFDVEKHAKTYIRYLEVIILEDGSVQYAVPSHQEFLIRYLCKKWDISRDELEMISLNDHGEYAGDFMAWLCHGATAVSVWTDGITYTSINQKQYDTLVTLKEHKVYYGELPDRSEISSN